MTGAILAGVITLCPGLVSAPANAAPCRLAIVLAIDVSSSVDSGEDRLQRAGIATALLAPDVARAFFGAPGRVALYAFEWSGSHHQSTLLDWLLVETPEDLRYAADTIRGSPRGRNDLPTAIGRALAQAFIALRRGPDCEFRKVDVSGDGQNNDGYAPANAYDAFDFGEITVNGLPVLGSGTADEIGLTDYYANEVLHGPDAFLETAADFGDFARAMRRKLLRELSTPILSDAQRACPGRGAGGDRTRPRAAAAPCGG